MVGGRDTQCNQVNDLEFWRLDAYRCAGQENIYQGHNANDKRCLDVRGA